MQSIFTLEALLQEKSLVKPLFGFTPGEHATSQAERRKVCTRDRRAHGREYPPDTLHAGPCSCWSGQSSASRLLWPPSRLLERPAPRHDDGSDLPKLVVIIVVDGLPQEQVVKYLDQLGEGGFKRLLGLGAWFTSAHYGHSMTETAVGHATIVTGAHPYRHGVVGNEWFDRKTKTQIYGVSDPTSLYVEEPTPAGVGTSPRNLRVPTIGDELRLKTGFQAKVLSLSLKDRGAILPGGKLGAAYWFSTSTGRFITSTYYRDVYPEWWQRFHAAAPQDRMVWHDVGAATPPRGVCPFGG